MKKIIIATALVLTSAVTAFSLSTKADSIKSDIDTKKDVSSLGLKSTSASPKSDIATAD